MGLQPPVWPTHRWQPRRDAWQRLLAGPTPLGVLPSGDRLHAGCPSQPSHTQPYPAIPLCRFPCCIHPIRTWQQGERPRARPLGVAKSIHARVRRGIYTPHCWPGHYCKRCTARPFHQSRRNDVITRALCCARGVQSLAECIVPSLSARLVPALRVHWPSMRQGATPVQRRALPGPWPGSIILSHARMAR